MLRHVLKHLFLCKDARWSTDQVNSFHHGRGLGGSNSGTVQLKHNVFLHHICLQQILQFPILHDTHNVLTHCKISAFYNAARSPTSPLSSTHLVLGGIAGRRCMQAEVVEVLGLQGAERLQQRSGQQWDVGLEQGPSCLADLYNGGQPARKYATGRLNVLNLLMKHLGSHKHFYYFFFLSR